MCASSARQSGWPRSWGRGPGGLGQVASGIAKANGGSGAATPFVAATVLRGLEFNQSRNSARHQAAASSTHGGADYLWHTCVSLTDGGRAFKNQFWPPSRVGLGLRRGKLTICGRSDVRHPSQIDWKWSPHNGKVMNKLMVAHTEAALPSHYKHECVDSFAIKHIVNRCKKWRWGSPIFRRRWNSTTSSIRFFHMLRLACRASTG